MDGDGSCIVFGINLWIYSLYFLILVNFNFFWILSFINFLIEGLGFGFGFGIRERFCFVVDNFDVFELFLLWCEFMGCFFLVNFGIVVWIIECLFNFFDFFFNVFVWIFR